jgi:hypothetical protein
MTDKPSHKDQFERFKEAARQLGCDEDKERFERKLGQIATAKARPPKQTRGKNKSGG